MRTVLVFKTSVTNSHKLTAVKPLLDSLMNQNERWNFDLEDCDKILRVEAVSLPASVIIQNLKKAGFACTELED